MTNELFVPVEARPHVVDDLAAEAWAIGEALEDLEDLEEEQPEHAPGEEAGADAARAGAAGGRDG